MTPKPMDTRTPGIRPARPGVAVLVAAGCAIVVAFQVALTLGAPLGAAALGGVNAGELPGELRVVTAGSAIVWFAASLVVLARGNVAIAPLPRAVAWWGTWVLVCILGVGTLLNFASSSAWERFGWGPFTLVVWTLCLVLARSGFAEQPPRSPLDET
jgi:hypothetical protein